MYQSVPTRITAKQMIDQSKPLISAEDADQSRSLLSTDIAIKYQSTDIAIKDQSEPLSTDHDIAVKDQSALTQALTTYITMKDQSKPCLSHKRNALVGTGDSRRNCGERGREREKIHERIKIPHTTLTKRRVLPRAYGGTINEKTTTGVKGYERKKNTTIAWEKKVHQGEKNRGSGS